jgi:hypothetical protein
MSDDRDDDDDDDDNMHFHRAPTNDGYILKR